jgi:hypothetical protein
MSPVGVCVWMGFATKSAYSSQLRTAHCALRHGYGTVGVKSNTSGSDQPSLLLLLLLLLLLFDILHFKKRSAGCSMINNFLIKTLIL